MQLGRVEVHRICWFWELHCLVHCEFKKISVPCFSSNLYWSVQKGPWHLFLKSCRSWFDPRVPNQNPSWHLGTAKAYESAPFCSGNVPLECLSFLGHLDSQLGPTCDWGIWSFCIPQQGKDIMKDRLGVHWPMFFFFGTQDPCEWPLFDLCFRMVFDVGLRRSGHWAPRKFDDRSPSTRQRWKLQGIESLDHAAASRWCGPRTRCRVVQVAGRENPQSSWLMIEVPIQGGCSIWPGEWTFEQKPMEEQHLVCLFPRS